MGEEREDTEISGGVFVEQDRGKNGVFEKIFLNGSIFATCVQGRNEMKVVVPEGSSLTISTVSRELSSGTCKLFYKGGQPEEDWLLICTLQGEHPVTALGLSCVGPSEFFLKAPGTKINVFGSISTSTPTLLPLPVTPPLAVDSTASTSEGGGVSVEQQRSKNKTDVYRKTFPNGSIFAESVVGTNEMQVIVPDGSSVTIASVSRELSSGTCKLFYRDASVDSEWMLLSGIHGHQVTGINLSCVGPSVFYLKAPGTKIDVFGSVASSARSASQSAEAEMSLDRSKKRKLEQSQEKILAADDEVPMDTTDTPESDNEAPKLSKKQRKKLAKKKAKELADAVATLNMHSKGEDTKDTKKEKKSESLTKERRLPSGVLVKDLMLGVGQSVKPGRKVSILYEASFPDGKVFDKNKNSAKPLEFRLGTGQVVRGLEHGLEGMRVGGEREITIPPGLGYGKKGSGNIVPPNSTLIFSVRVTNAG